MRWIIFVLALLVLSGCQSVDEKFACQTDSDCVKDSCCHATGCVGADHAPDCSGAFCTMECRPGTLDCGGSCVCNDGSCEAVFDE